jgi:hypothetical protein|tara:strand:+ start:303 stop:578 length:276 start_codon:yes stop_codon:yes gene_type:complete
MDVLSGSTIFVTTEKGENMSTKGHRTIFPQKIRQQTLHGVMPGYVWAQWFDRQALLSALMGAGVSAGDTLCSFVVGLPATKRAIRLAKEAR